MLTNYQRKRNMDIIQQRIEFKPFSLTTSSIKCSALASTLQLTIEQFKGVVDENQQLKEMYTKLTNDFRQQQSESQSCKSCLDLKDTITSKDNIIQSVASQLTVLSETKNFKLLDEVFKIICGEVTTLTPKDSPKDETKRNGIIKFSTPGPSNELKDDSVSEIEGTPTGRTSPIIQSKKLRSRFQIDTDTSKKKCSNSWPIPEAKQAKLNSSTSLSLSRTRGTRGGGGGGKTRQTRLVVSRTIEPRLVDLTSSPGGAETIVKNERVDSDETIMPSPTSGPVKPEFNKYKLVYASPSKTKKQQELVEIKKEMAETPTKTKDHDDVTEMEHSINLFNPNRFKKSPSKFKLPVSASKIIKENRTSDEENLKPQDGDETRIDESINLLKPYKFEPLSETFSPPRAADDSLSLLHANGKQTTSSSPSKRPLEVNVNAHNVPEPSDTQVSAAGRRAPRAAADIHAANNANCYVKRPQPEPLYKEPAVRKKAEKRALPGWSCDQCKNFYSELYKDNEEMLRKLMEECSRHRARRDPARPGTPPAFWHPRWSVPQDTEAFNARNNVD